MKKLILFISLATALTFLSSAVIAQDSNAANKIKKSNDVSNFFDNQGIGKVPSKTPAYQKPKQNEGNTKIEISKSNLDLANLIFSGLYEDVYFRCPHIRIMSEIMCIGASDSGSTESFVVGFYLSTDKNVTTSDCRIDNRTIPPPSTWSEEHPPYMGSEAFDLCSSIECVTNGTYWVGIILDENNDVAESNEDDNIWCFSDSIVINCCSDCEINIDTPNEGEVWCENTSHTVRWQSGGTTGNVKITYTPNGGAWWTSITNSTPDNGTYEWTIPQLSQTSTQCLIRIYDRDNFNCYDESDDHFTLRDGCGCSITVDVPNGEETWNQGSTHDILWHSSGTSGNVKLLYKKKGNSWKTIIESTPDNGIFTWKLPEFLTSRCLVRIEDVSDENCFDTSDEYCTILGLPNFYIFQHGAYCSCPIIGAYLEILIGGSYEYPVGNFSVGFYLSDDDTITMSDCKIATVICDPSSWPSDIPSGPAFQEYEICCHPCVENGTYYLGAILDENNDVIEFNEDDNVYYFTDTIVIDCCSDCRINIDTPSGGEDWCENTTQTIRWQPGNAVGNVKITYTPNGGAWWRTITNSTPDNGIYEWKIPPLSQTSMQCLVRVFDRTCYGESNNFFTLRDSCSYSITIDDPNGAESWNEGSTHDILWHSNGTSGNVKIRYSFTGGWAWLDLIDSTLDDGIYSWTLPTVGTTQISCKVRVEDVANNACNDVSDNCFYIVDIPTDIPSICILMPTSAAPDSEFWVEIEVGSISHPINEISAIAFELLYTNTQIVDYVTHEIGSFISNANATVQPDDANGKISVSVYRTDGGGNSGSGTVIRIKFKILENATSEETICYNMGNIQAQNSVGTQIQLAPCTYGCVDVLDLIVWPGDTDNDGDDDIFDILPIVSVQNWEVTGQMRPNASTDWIGQPCSPWTPVSATYCDCNATGKIDIFDILTVVGPNYGKTHPMLTGSIVANESILKNSLTDPPILVEARDYDEINSDFWIDVMVGSSSQPVTDMKSIAFELTYTNTENINYDSYQIGAFLSGAQATVMPEDANGKISAAVYRLSGTGETGNGAILSIKFKAGTGHNIDFDFPGAQAESSTGNSISLAPQGKSLVTRVVINDLQVTSDFELIQNYPNPFNPETTIEYTVPNVSEVILTIYDINGHEIRELVHEQKDAGHYSVMWNARDKNRKIVSSGVYFYQIEIRSRDRESQLFFDVKKMILMK
jgi:hypothetical protein